MTVTYALTTRTPSRSSYTTSMDSTGSKGSSHDFPGQTRDTADPPAGYLDSPPSGAARQCAPTGSGCPSRPINRDDPAIPNPAGSFATMLRREASACLGRRPTAQVLVPRFTTGPTSPTPNLTPNASECPPLPRRKRTTPMTAQPRRPRTGPPRAGSSHVRERGLRSRPGCPSLARAAPDGTPMASGAALLRDLADVLGTPMVGTRRGRRRLARPMLTARSVSGIPRSAHMWDHTR